MSKPANLIVAGFSRYAEALDWGCRRLESVYGPVTHAVEFAFVQTGYYERTMGSDLRKRLWAFGRFDPAALADVKRASGELEREYAAGAGHGEPRPLNLDPGYVDLGKLVLASTKDHSHRIYLRDGIYAEVTLFYREGAFRPWPWTYADYRLEEVLSFLNAVRSQLKEQRGEQA